MWLLIFPLIQLATRYSARLVHQNCELAAEVSQGLEPKLADSVVCHDLYRLPKCFRAFCGVDSTSQELCQPAATRGLHHKAAVLTRSEQLVKCQNCEQTFFCCKRTLYDTDSASATYEHCSVISCEHMVAAVVCCDGGLLWVA